MQTVKDRQAVTTRRPRGEAGEVVGQSWRESPEFLDIPGIDMYTKDGNLVTEVSLPEFEQDAVEVTATGEGLEISAFRKAKVSDGPKDRTYFMHEGRWSYWRQVRLPPAARPEELKYSLRDGKLRITMPIGKFKMSGRQATDNRKEESHDLHRTTPTPKSATAIEWRDQEFPDHWTRYRPAR